MCPYNVQPLTVLIVQQHIASHLPQYIPTATIPYVRAEVIKWFAERADMIIVMFDAHKLDISDELKTVLDVLKPHQDKIR